MKIFNKKKKEESSSTEISEDKKETVDVKTGAKKSMKDLYAGEVGITKTRSTGKNNTEEKIINNGRAYRVLLRPLITEKASNLGVLNKYFFAVADEANKIEISKAVFNVYGIKPIAVNVVSMQGKKTRNGKIKGKRKDWKKAIVTLPKGKSINLYEGV